MRAWSCRAGLSVAIVGVGLALAGSALSATITVISPASDFIPEVANACVGTSVQITGSGFVNDGGPVTVMFNNVPAIEVTIGSDSVIYAKMPNGATPGYVTVTTAKGTATSPTTFGVASCAVNTSPALIAIGSTKTTTTTTTKPKPKLIPKCKKGQKSTKAHPCKRT
jgi:hypothetical protein